MARKTKKHQTKAASATVDLVVPDRISYTPHISNEIIARSESGVNLIF